MQAVRSGTFPLSAVRLRPEMHFLRVYLQVLRPFLAVQTADTHMHVVVKGPLPMAGHACPVVVAKRCRVEVVAIIQLHAHGWSWHALRVCIE